MSEVPPQEPDLSSQTPAQQGAASTSDTPPPFDPLVPPPPRAPYRTPEPAPPLSSSDGAPQAASAPDSPSPFNPLVPPPPRAPYRAPEPAPPLNSGNIAAQPPTPLSPVPTQRLPVATTGVPHHVPASPLELPAGIGGPALAYGSDGTAVALPPARPRSILRPVGRGVREIAETIVLALLIFLLVRAVVQNFQVDGKSMEPTLEHGWYLLVNKALYWEINLETVNKFVPFVEPGSDPTRYVFRGPRRGDVIVFISPTTTPGETERDFIKRVIGLPGETVAVHDCTVFIDGKPLHEPYITDPPRYDHGPEIVPPGHYFVLGDNRNNSADSHSWGMLPKDNIIGQAFLVYWPFHNFGTVDNTSAKPDAAEEGQPDAKQSAICGAPATVP